MAAEKIMRLLELWIKRVNQGFLIFAGSMIVFMAVLAAYGSARRYVFNSPEPVSYELGKMFLLLSFVLAIAAVDLQNRFLRCDLLLERFPGSFCNIISNIVSPILGIIFFGIITWISFGDSMRAYKIDQHSQSSWPVPLFPIKLMIPVGYGFLCLVLLIRLVHGLIRLTASPGEVQDSVD